MESWREAATLQLQLAVVCARTRGRYSDAEIKGLVDHALTVMAAQEVAR